MPSAGLMYFVFHKGTKIYITGQDANMASLPILLFFSGFVYGYWSQAKVHLPIRSPNYLTTGDKWAFAGSLTGFGLVFYFCGPYVSQLLANAGLVLNMH
jgi:hypothetical protein